jgi:hypothetical protein
MFREMIKWKRILLPLFLGVVSTAAIAIGAAPQAHAAVYSCYGNGMSSRVFVVRYSGVNATWESYFTTARNRWNSSGAGTNISANLLAGPYMTAGNYTTQSWYGLYTPQTPNFSIQVNATTLTRDAPSTYLTAWIQSTSTHELGHAVRLIDDPNTTAPSLMAHGRDRSSVGSPTSYDVANVLACY